MCDSITETGLEAAQQRLLQYDGSVLPAVPPYHNLLAAMLGVGIQILALAMCMFVLGLGGVFYPFNRGRQLVALVAFYALTAGIAGYVGGLHYRRLGGTDWAPNARLCSAVLGAPFLAVFTCLNTIAATYRSTAAVPFSALSSLGLGWALVAFPLTMLGGFAARNARVEPLAGAGVGSSRAAKPSSDGSYRLWPCHHTTLLRAAMAGALLFWAVHIELWYLLASVWGLNLYALYTPLLAVFVLLVLNTALVTAACTLLDLQRLGVEDPGWWWNSFLCGGSTGIYVCGYCCYFFARSSMRGLLQTAFFLGYSAVACWALFLVLGAVGAHASLLVVRRTVALR
ncbi:hypothetical protein HYH03_007908 [Edaphochlamys debaryana]|uniref:Transmembrane 9 superfamily member n=1 Tax=Edaphochlamys debaryana TaxID=47281 RepID=A0A835Y151_9CHLO|nr:hypothetical protein HYH03_007908 [Edaphochlamys debaryana]|eukprot:KAG2493981.1 hypothetical protein HYH03_007908 [Edaphochlamys debaryana]